MTELEKHIQQMAEKEAYSPTGRSRRAYLKGFNAADAVGFAEWVRTDKTANAYFEYRGLKQDGKYVTSEELYLIYLKSKTK